MPSIHELSSNPSRTNTCLHNCNNNRTTQRDVAAKTSENADNYYNNKSLIPNPNEAPRPGEAANGTGVRPEVPNVVKPS